ncbi:MAG: alkaline phosphatase family protein, partial [Candidatus Lokiarchaeota archaeon]
NLQIYKMNQDLGNNCKTILEMVGEENTASITQYINRGNKYFFPENKLKLIFYYLIVKFSRNMKKMMAQANTIVIDKLIKNFERPKKYFGNDEPPIASLLWFMTSDVLMHLYGFDSFIYKLNLMHIDKVIGILLKKLKTLGYLDETVIAIIADHGNYRAKKVGNLSNFFRGLGLSNYDPRKSINGNFNISEYSSVGLFNFKSNKYSELKNYSWYRPSISELQEFGPKKVNLMYELFKIPDSHLMFYPDDNNRLDKGIIHLRKKDANSSKICYGKIEYRGISTNLRSKLVLEDEDENIFGYSISDDQFSNIYNKFHSLEEWLELTHNLDYPLYPDLLVRHFKNPRSADLIISNKGNIVYNIAQGERKNENLHNHDIGLRKSAVVPLIIGGSPEIPKKEIKFCKTIDIVPTLLKMMAIKPDKSYIGKSLV